MREDRLGLLEVDAHPLADAPTVRAAKLIAFELSDLLPCGEKAAECLEESSVDDERDAWGCYLYLDFQFIERWFYDVLF